MNSIIKTIKLLIVCFLVTGSLFAQQRRTKVEQSIKVDKDVSVELNTSHCNIVFDVWNKNTIEIEAYIEGERLTGEALDQALKSWNVDIDATQSHVSINTGNGNSRTIWVDNESSNDGDLISIVLDELKFELADLPEAIMNGLTMDIPNVPALPEMPELPALPEGINNMEFDYDAYKRDGEAYLEKYTEKFDSTYGKEFEARMEAWGEKFGEEWGERFGKRMEAWGEAFEKRFNDEEFTNKMEAWGERYAEQMEAHAERMKASANRREAHADRVQALKERAKERSILIKNRHKEVEKLLNDKSGNAVKKTIKIKMPKAVKLKLNVKYGEVEFASNIDNLKADLSHSKLTAESINGSSTSINASYSPIAIGIWNLGELNLNYVKEAELGVVNNLVLNAVSSNIEIENLSGSAIIDGNIGDLSIDKIDDTFNNLNIILQNSNAFIKLPTVNCNVQFKGSHTEFRHPNHKGSINSTSYSENKQSSKNIIINAKYSNVEME